MKTTAPKTTATLQRQPTPQEQGPFFRKEEQGAYAVNGAETATLDGPSNVVSTKRDGTIWGGQPFFQPTNNGNHQAVQAKLTIGQPNDKYEQEADRMADSVVDRISNNGQREGTIPATVQAKEEEEIGKKEQGLQKKPAFESEEEAPVNRVQTKEEDTSNISRQETSEAVDHDQQAPEEDVEELNSKDSTVQEKLDTPASIEDTSTHQLQTKVDTPSPVSEVNAAVPSIMRTPLLQKQEEEEQELSEKEEGLRRKPIFESAATPPDEEGNNDQGALMAKSEDGQLSGTDNLQNQLDSTKGGGQPLPKDTQSEMGTAIGADFSGVRIHHDEQASSMNKGLNAQAFTHGSDIYFNDGKYNPDSSSGKELLAHELTHTVQQGASGVGIQRKPEDHIHPEDGGNVKGRMHDKVDDEVGDDADFSKSPGQMTAEEREKARNVDPSEKNAQKAEIKSAGTAKPDVDRPGEELPKVVEAKEEGKENLEEEPKTEEGKEKKLKKAPRADLSASDAKEAAAQAAEQEAAQMKKPDKPEPLPEPRMEKPKDSKGEPLPPNAEMDKAVKALHEIAKLFAENAYSFKEEAHTDGVEGKKMRKQLNVSWAKTARVNAGSKVMKEDKLAREDANTLEEEALTKVEADTAMVKEEAPKLKEKADEGQEENGPMVEESKAKKQEMEAKKPDDADAAKDAEKQSEDTGKAAEGAESSDEALSGTGERAEKYLQDAIEGEKKNQQTRATVDENKQTLANTGKEIERIDTHNAQSEAQLGALDHYPGQVEQETAQRAKSGDELYAAAVSMNDDLIDIQEEYLNTMGALPSREAAQEEADKKAAEENPPEEAEKPPTPEEEMLLTMGNMEEEEMNAMLLTMDESELQNLESTLGGMETQEEQEQKEDGIVGEKDQSGRSKVDLMKLFESDDQEQGPPDPRQEQISEIDNRRAQRIGQVKQVSDVNFTFLSAEQKAMLAQKLAMSNAVSGLFDINILEMGKGMIMGMINPVESLKGVLDGASKMASGVVNLFNAEAWAKDPLGNLLQSAADIATGLTTIFMSITGLATAITIIMTVITIASFGFAAPITGPIIAFMTTVISTVGSWTIITGLIALALNALTYIKNLHDAGTAENTDELIFESDQLKQNMTDGFTSAMAVVGGKGDVAGAKAMKGAIAKGGGPAKFMQQKGLNFKAGVKKVGTKALGAGKKLAAGAKRMTTAGFNKVKGGISKAYQKIKGGIEDIGSGARKKFNQLKDNVGGKKKVVETPDGVRVPKEKGALGDVGGKKVEAEVDLPGGHKKKVLEDGQCATCSICKKTREKFKNELDDNPEIKTQLDELEKKLDIDPENPDLIKKHIELEDSLDAIKNPSKKRPKSGEAGSPEHKAQRWEDYQARKKAEGKEPYSYERWSQQYDVNMQNPKKGGLREQQYREHFGGESEIVDIDMPDGSVQKRQLDVKNGNEIYEIKTAREYLTKSGKLPNETRILKDKMLVDQGFEVTWVLEKGGSKKLTDALDLAGIKWVTEIEGMPPPPVQGVDF